MEAIHAEMQKHFKITAKKKLYFSLSVLFLHAAKHLENITSGGASIIELAQQNGHELTNEALRAISSEKLNTIRALYCIGSSLRDYKQAMGEYPEFTKFLASTPDALEKMIGGTIAAMEEAEKALGTSRNKPQKIAEHAFGSGFITLSEQIKIKGEI